MFLELKIESFEINFLHFCTTRSLHTKSEATKISIIGIKIYKFFTIVISADWSAVAD